MTGRGPIGLYMAVSGRPPMLLGEVTGGVGAVAALLTLGVAVCARWPPARRPRLFIGETGKDRLCLRP